MTQYTPRPPDLQNTLGMIKINTKKNPKITNDKNTPKP